MAEGGKEAVRVDDEVVASAEVKALEKRIRELERVLGKKGGVTNLAHFRGGGLIWFSSLTAEPQCSLTGGCRAEALVRRTCLTAGRCKSSTQPDGGEGLAKRKGVAARRGLKEAWSKCTSRWTRTGYEACHVGRVG
jgi:hypothetical protein